MPDSLVKTLKVDADISRRFDELVESLSRGSRRAQINHTLGGAILGFLDLPRKRQLELIKRAATYRCEIMERESNSTDQGLEREPAAVDLVKKASAAQRKTRRHHTGS